MGCSLLVQCSSCHPINGVKSPKKTQTTDFNKLTSLILSPSTTGLLRESNGPSPMPATLTTTTTTTTTVLRSFVWDYLVELVPEKAFMPSSEFYCPGEDDRARHTDSPDKWHPIWAISAPTFIIPTIFIPDALPVTTLTIDPGLG